MKIIAERVSLIQMSNTIKKLFYRVIQTSSEMLSFLHRQGYYRKCEVNANLHDKKRRMSL